MNFSEFKKLLGADPLNKDPDTLAARASGPEFEQAAAEAEAFEGKLRGALEIPVDSEALVSAILEAPRTPERRWPNWMAIAASLIVVAGVAGLLIGRFGQPGTIEQYVADHYHYDGLKFLSMAAENKAVDPQVTQALMASWDMETSDELNLMIAYIDRCPTLEGHGAHMIVQTERGMVNLIVMPNTTVKDRELVEFDGMQAYLVSLGDYSAAIIGTPEQVVSSMDQLVRSSIHKTT